MNRIVAFLLLMVASIGTAPAAAAQGLPPRPDGPIYDGANILSPATEARLDQQLRGYSRETGRAIIVATVPDLGGEPIEPYATRLFADWGIGGAERDQGLLLLVAPNERRMRIEVGYGLHPYFGGIMAGRVIRDVITPQFKAGDYDAGVVEGVDAILQHLARTPAEAAAIEEAAQAAAEQERSEGGFPIGAIFWIGFLLVFFVLPALGGGKRRRYRRRGGIGGLAGDIILWEAGKAIARGLSDGDDWGGGGGFGGGGFGGGGGGFGGFGGGMSGGGGASGGW